VDEASRASIWHRVVPDQRHRARRDGRRKPREFEPTIFEGTPEIQQLVIARAISGMRIEMDMRAAISE
jgi:hypothetical protein